MHDSTLRRGQRRAAPDEVSDPVGCPGFADGEPCGIDSKQIKDYDAHAVYDDSAEWKDFGYAVSDSINVGIPGESGPWPEDCVAKPGQVVCIYADIWYTVVSLLDAWLP